MIRNSEFLLRQVAGSHVLVPVGQAAVNFAGMITLNDTGVFLWEQLEKDHTLESLADAMVDTYEVSKETALADAKLFVDNLSQAGAVLS